MIQVNLSKTIYILSLTFSLNLAYANGNISIMAKKIGLLKVSECSAASTAVQAFVLGNPNFSNNQKQVNDLNNVAKYLGDRYDQMGVSLIGRERFSDTNRRNYEMWKSRSAGDWISKIGECSELFVNAEK